MQKGFTAPLIILGIVFLIAIVAGVYYLGKTATKKPFSSQIPIISQTPASGICVGPLSGKLVKIVIGLDNVPMPRCIKVTADQKLEIINNGNRNIGGVGNIKILILAGKTQLIDVNFGSYLSPGVHNIAGAEIWLQ